MFRVKNATHKEETQGKGAAAGKGKSDPLPNYAGELENILIF
jgi:hypothetical protein